ncbi:hypothetical protein PSSHI_03240 [Photobacterium sp. R1]
MGLCLPGSLALNREDGFMSGQEEQETQNPDWCCCGMPRIPAFAGMALIG